ncbi:rod shape-determining protein MreC [Ekhidna lutea]|uniref:Cell shape-determining protein MreC n=1 Tax=Ekhidna lutea TaxID=447679 RepID=A0A239ETS8_EKHLU|nr:rod shape-determining protein MreC [Ekhidna lutea]SNS48160.1 rod shape-determining protein MreC [Ekhidna lutea]
MQRLLDFLYQQREIAVFLGLEILSAWLLINFNNRYNASFLNSSNEAAASITQTTNDINDYFQLSEINEQLMLENEQLQQELRMLRSEKLNFLDTVDQYRVIGARVINNTFERAENFVTISAGVMDSVEVGMGVISSFGVVGQVKSVSDNFATIYSLLHPKVLLSAKVKRTDTKCTVQWDQETFDRAALKYIPRHIKMKVGDSIVTSGFNSVFPENILVGVVDELHLEEHMTFYEAKVKLATDFTSLYHVFVIKDVMKNEKDSLEAL